MKNNDALKAMHRSHWSKITCRLIILILIAFIFFTGLETPDESVISIPDKEERLYPISLQGLRFQRFESNRITTRAIIKELKVNPRKFFIFNIRPFNELTLNNVTMEFYKSEEKHSGLDISNRIHRFSSGSGERSLFPKNLEFGDIKTGIITRGVVNTLILKIYAKSRLSKIVKSHRAYLDFKKNEVIFYNATVEDIATKQIIKSRKMVFKNGRNVIRVPGQYVLLSQTELKKGNDLIINL